MSSTAVAGPAVPTWAVGHLNGHGVSAALRVGLTLSPPGALLAAVGATQQLAVTAITSDGSTTTATSSATWSSSDTAVATVSSGGLVTAVAAGSATITATVGNQTGTATVSLAAPAVGFGFRAQGSGLAPQRGA